MRISDWSSDVCSSDLVEAPGFTGLGPDTPRLDYYDDSTSHNVQVSAGVRPGVVAPVGLTASAGYEREDAGQLDQRYEDKYVRGDVLAPVSATVALTAGVGYEELETSQKDPLLDADRSEEHTSELQSLMRRSYAV